MVEDKKRECKKLTTRKKVLLISLFFIAALGIELLFFNRIGIRPFPLYYVLTIGALLIVSGILLILPRGAWLALAIICLLWFALIATVNYNMFVNQQRLFAIDLLTRIDFLADAAIMSAVSINSILVFFSPVLAFILLAVMMIFLMNKPAAIVQMRVTARIFLGLIIASIGAICFVWQANNFFVNDYDGQIIKEDRQALFEEFSAPLSYLKHFGTIPFMFRAFFPAHHGDVPTHEEIMYFFKQENSFEKSELFGIDYGNNVIVIMLESVEWFMIHPVYTPNLYEVLERSIIFDNFHHINDTLNSELAMIFGSLPQNQNIGAVLAPDDQKVDHGFCSFAFSMPNILRQSGFEHLNFFHPSSYRHYSRMQTHQGFGFDELFFGDNATIEEAIFDWWPCLWHFSEHLFVERMSQFMIRDERFFTFFTTINAHGPYEPQVSETIDNFNLIDDNNFSQELKDNPAFDHFKGALAKMMILDSGIGLLYETLESRGKLDSTTVVFFSDHPAQYDGLKGAITGYLGQMPGFFRIPAFIDSPNVNHMVIDCFVNIFDLHIGIYELLGIRVNPAFFLGQNPFTNPKSTYVMPNGSVINHLFFTLDGINVLYRSLLTTDDDFKQFQLSHINQKNKMRFTNLLFTENLEFILKIASPLN